MLCTALAAFVASAAAKRAFCHLKGQVATLYAELATEVEHEHERLHGLRTSNEHDRLVDPSAWTPEFSRTADWAYGETQGLLAGDVVYEFGWHAGPLCGRGGFALECKGRIVAQRETGGWIS